MKRLHLIGLESIETRYTKEWKTHLPSVFGQYVEVIDDYYGEELSSKVENSDFLNWTSTNYFKSSQLMKISKAISEGKVENGDIFFFADFWNPVVIQLVYMLKMSKLDCKIVGLAHAGMYDPWDRLSDDFNCIESPATHIKLYYSEKAIIGCYDYLYFATQFHLDLFSETYKLTTLMDGQIQIKGYITKVIVCGFPFEYIRYFKSDCEKKNKILFTQRNAPEKQPHLFMQLKQLAKEYNILTDYEFVNINHLGYMTKDKYHNLLAESKCVVSFALQETLGITPYEALAFDCEILVPDRLSYSEMYSKDYKYKSDAKMEVILQLLINKMQTYSTQLSINKRSTQRLVLDEQFFNCDKMMKHIRSLR